MIERYDLIVIGAGPAGLSAAIEAAKNGMKPIAVSYTHLTLPTICSV